MRAEGAMRRTCGHLLLALLVSLLLLGLLARSVPGEGALSLIHI